MTIKVVFDTNVYVSAFGIPGSLSEEVYRLALSRKIRLVTSPAILAETANAFGRKFDVSDEDIQSALRQIADVAKVVKPKVSLAVLSDEADNRILECALHVRADFIISGDKHLRVLKDYQGTRIVTVSEFH